MFTSTGYKQFQRCERQWYFKNIVADTHIKNDPVRREVTILSKLDSVEAWRGKIVDDIVSRLLVNSINKRYQIDKEYLLQAADELFERQLEYAAFQRYREPNRTYHKDNDFAALQAFEFGNECRDEVLVDAKQDVRNAINNLIDDTEFINYLRSGAYLVSQRTLRYDFPGGLQVVSKPDLIIFFKDKAPHIVDWKVHSYGINTYDEQLISYAVALYKVVTTKPHADFPFGAHNHSIFDYKLTEYQLLHPSRLRRDYEVTLDKLEELNDKMSKGILEMYMKGCHKKYGDVDPEVFETTPFFDNCKMCSFSKICKQTSYEGV